MIDVWGSGCVDPFSLDLNIICRLVDGFPSRPLYSRGNRRVGGLKLRRKENTLDLAWIQTPTSPSFRPQPVVILTVLVFMP
jgi:hypothetical protein